MLLGSSTGAIAQTESEAAEIEIRLEEPIVVKPARSSAGPLGDKYLTNYLIGRTIGPRKSSLLQMPATTSFHTGHREMTNTELVFQGVGMGATMGSCVGAFGSSFGWWDEDDAYAIAGIMSALGAIWTMSKMDEPEFRYQPVLEEDPAREGQ